MDDAPPVITYLDGQKPFAVFCDVCKSTCWRLSTFGDGPGALDAALTAASTCCHLPKCKTCGEPMPNRGFCNPCRSKANAEQEQAEFDKATKVPFDEYSGEMVNDGDEAYFAPEDYEDHDPLVAADGTLYFWGTTSEKASVDLERSCGDDWLQDHHEDAFDQVDLKKLAEAQKLVDEALDKVITFYPDKTVAVVVPPVMEES